MSAWTVLLELGSWHMEEEEEDFLQQCERRALHRRLPLLAAPLKPPRCDVAAAEKPAMVMMMNERTSTDQLQPAQQLPA